MSSTQPYMPVVDALPPEKLATIFDQAHAMSTGGMAADGKSPSPRCLVLLTPGRLARALMTPPPNTMAPANVQAILALLPLPPKRVAAIGFTANLLQAGIPEISAAIPFFGFLLGFAYVGHSAVLFEGHPLAFEAGVRGVDMLLVDSVMTPFLPPHWTETAFRVMRTPEINVYNRDNPQPSRVQRIIDPVNNIFNRGDSPPPPPS